MKKLKLIFLGLLVIFTAGCTMIDTPPSVIQNHDYSNILNYNFADLTDSCSMHTNISIDNNTVCIAEEREAFVFYDNVTNWNMFCCDFSTQCFNQNYTDVTDVCSVNNNTAFSGYVYENNGKWLGFCCDMTGENCYVDSNVIITDETTLCDMEYTLSTFSLNFNTTIWDAICCKGGVI